MTAPFSTFPTPSFLHTLDHALPPLLEVVVVASTAAVVEHLALPGVDVEGEPLLHTVARPRVDGTEAGPRRPQLCDITHRDLVSSINSITPTARHLLNSTLMLSGLKNISIKSTK